MDIGDLRNAVNENCLRFGTSIHTSPVTAIPFVCGVKNDQNARLQIVLARISGGLHEAQTSATPSQHQA
jgi:hypothetical protein